MKPLLSPTHALTMPQDLERRCRVNGLSNKGGQLTMITRLLALDTYLNGSGDGLSGGGGGLVVPPSTGVFASSEDPSALAGVSVLHHGHKGEGSAAAAASADPSSSCAAAGGISEVPPAVVIPAAVAQSRWTSIEEDEDREKTVLEASLWIFHVSEEDPSRLGWFLDRTRT